MGGARVRASRVVRGEAIGNIQTTSEAARLLVRERRGCPPRLRSHTVGRMARHRFSLSSSDQLGKKAGEPAPALAAAAAAAQTCQAGCPLLPRQSRSLSLRFQVLLALPQPCLCGHPPPYTRAWCFLAAVTTVLLTRPPHPEGCPSSSSSAASSSLFQAPRPPTPLHMCCRVSPYPHQRLPQPLLSLPPESVAPALSAVLSPGSAMFKSVPKE